MSGDVQPRKRKDKKRKKDDLSIEEPRGTSATLGEGDVFMHSQHEHGTGGHWCAKIIFFSLLAVLITLIGLIILENRGLSELEANAVESRYSGVLEGWLEDAPDDDHHDEHTLELAHHDDEHDDDDDEEVEVEKLEKEEPDEDPISTELPALPEDEDDNDELDDEKSAGDVTDEEPDKDDEADEEDEYLENDDIDEPMVEHITAPPGKPLPEVEDDTSTEKPPDTLAEEEEYEKRQEELRREEEQSSHMWLKLTVGGALLAATHAVMRRATQPRDSPEDEEPATREDTPLTDRRLTLIPEEQPIYVPVKSGKAEVPEPSFNKLLGNVAPQIKPCPVKKEDSEEEEKYSDEEEIQETAVSREDNKELFSDEEEEVEEDEPIAKEPKQITKQNISAVESKPNPEPEEYNEVDDVEIIDDEQLEEELIDEEDEEEISDVDDAELLTRLEAKYGKLPEPERFGPKQYKDGGNSLVDDDWPGEPSDAYWRDQLDSAEQEMLQDWLD